MIYNQIDLNTQKTAILFFSRTAKTEARIKPLAQGKRASAAVAEFTIETVFSIAKQTDIPLFVITEKDQRGHSFGERFAHAFEDIYQKGFEKVIAIGNDCLTISSDDILAAAENLDQNNCVIGPSLDGGAYIIGLHKNSFKKQNFADISWQSDETLSGLQSYIAHENVNCILLSLKEDIDTISDWSVVLNTIPSLIKKEILRLFTIGAKTLTDSFNIFITNCYYATTKSLRAPPFSI